MTDDLAYRAAEEIARLLYERAGDLKDSLRCRACLGTTSQTYEAGIWKYGEVTHHPYCAAARLMRDLIGVRSSPREQA